MSRILGAGLTVLAPVSVLAPGRAAAQTAAGLTGPPSQWSLGLSVSGAWYENPQFNSAPAATAWSTTGRMTLSRMQRFRTGTFTLSGYGGRIYYPEIKDLGQWTYGGEAGLGLAPSRSTRLNLSQTYARSNTRQLPSLDLEGLPVPTTGVDTAFSALALTQGLARRTQLEIAGAFTWRRYDNPEVVGGQQLHSTVGLAHQLSDDGAVFVSYGFSQSWYEEQRGRVHMANVGVRNTSKSGVSFEVSGGAAYLESVGKYYPTGRAQLGVGGRNASASVLYFRDFGLAFGYGREMIADRVLASLSWTPAERVTLSAQGSYGYRRDPADEEYRVRSYVASAGFSWGITRDLAFAARYSWEQSNREGFSDVNGGSARASLSYGIDWR